MMRIIVNVQMLILNFLYLTRSSIQSKNINDFCHYEFKNRLQNFQPENGQKFKNITGWPKKCSSHKKKNVPEILPSCCLSFSAAYGRACLKSNMGFLDPKLFLPKYPGLWLRFPPSCASNLFLRGDRTVSLSWLQFLIHRKSSSEKKDLEATAIQSLRSTTEKYPAVYKRYEVTQDKFETILNCHDMVTILAHFGPFWCT